MARSHRRGLAHSLRHTFATFALEDGVPLHELQDSIGHADPRTTRRYDRARHVLARDASLVCRAPVRNAYSAGVGTR